MIGRALETLGLSVPGAQIANGETERWWCWQRWGCPVVVDVQAAKVIVTHADVWPSCCPRAPPHKETTKPAGRTWKIRRAGVIERQMGIISKPGNDGPRRECTLQKSASLFLDMANSAAQGAFQEQRTQRLHCRAGRSFLNPDQAWRRLHGGRGHIKGVDGASNK